MVKFLACLLLLLAGSGCSAKQSVRAMVIEAHSNLLTVSHEGGLTTLKYRKHALQELNPGDLIQLEMRQGQARRIEQDGSLGGTNDAVARLRIGEPIPDFRFIDHYGQAVSLSQLRGKLVLINFIYTRCPLVEFCPKLTNDFSVLQEHFAKRSRRQLALLTISLDPGHDSPAVLNQFARQWRAQPGWLFLSGQPEGIRQFCEQVGVGAWPDEGLLVHTMRTLAVGPDGRLVASIDGAQYQVGQLLDLVQNLLETSWKERAE